MATFQLETLDLHFLNHSELIASYLLKTDEGVALIETGPASCLKQLESELVKYDVKLSDISHVFVTHIHLDHAGAAWYFAQHGASVYVHHRGAPHLIDPSKLWASAGRVYGEENMESLWGSMQPIPKEQIIPLHDGDKIEIFGQTIIAHDTPGHAEHHIVFQLGDLCFMGDVGGTRNPDSKHIRIPTPPPEFNLEKWLATIQKLRKLQPRRLYLTHFGGFGETELFFEQLENNLHAVVDFVRKKWELGDSSDKIAQDYTEWIAEIAMREGTIKEKLQNYEMMVGSDSSVTGISRYLKKLSGGRA